MSTKLLVCVYGRANVGKTSSLVELKYEIGNELLRNSVFFKFNDVCSFPKPDFCGYYDTSKAKIGISSAGDDAASVQKGLNALLQVNCDMIFIASRTKGQSSDAVQNFAKTNNYELIWLAKENLYDFNQAWAKTNAQTMKGIMIKHTVETCEAIIHSVYPNLI